MTDTIVHLDKEQTRQQRRKLLANDVYVLFCDHLKQLRKDGRTELSPTEVFLSAMNFASLLKSLPNIEDGIDDELDDLEEDAEGENDAMIISMVATAIMCAVKNRHPNFDYKFAIIHIYIRWNDHPLSAPMLYAAARKEETQWMEGKKTDLLTCELREIENNKEGEDAVRELFQFFVGMSASVDIDTIKANLLILNKYNSEHGYKYQQYIDALYDKLGIKTTTQVNIAEQHNSNCQQFMGKMENPNFITPQQNETT